ncbi:GNAT family N-acetyltransferase, partial [Halomonas sp. BBD48]|nr:GNAT family N-acetyltransferase [Halomonas sp. BBD48]
HAFAARLTQIDYDREMALVAFMPGGTEICAVVRLIADPDKDSAEYAVMVRSDMKHTGLGYRLMSEILDYAKATGIRRVFADVLRENEPMLKMAREFGFIVKGGAQGDDSVTVERYMQSA